MKVIYFLSRSRQACLGKTGDSTLLGIKETSRMGSYPSHGMPAASQLSSDFHMRQEPLGNASRRSHSLYDEHASACSRYRYASPGRSSATYENNGMHSVRANASKLQHIEDSGHEY
jgi:hypothetical protein